MAGQQSSRWGETKQAHAAALAAVGSRQLQRAEAVVVVVVVVDCRRAKADEGRSERRRQVL
jgi:hypothetical protein